MKQRETILVIDDNEQLRQVLVDRLSEEEYIMKEAGSAEQGLDILREQKADLILLDLLLPDKSGVEMLKTAKEDKDIDLHETEVIILTSLEDPSAISTVLREGMYDFYIKTQVSPEDIVDHVNVKLERRGKGVGNKR